MTKAKKVRNNYVDNKKFSLAMEEFIKLVKHNQLHNLPEPRIPEYIGECILKICENLAKMPSFYNYSYKDQMISDAVYNCLLYIKNFRPEIPNSNAFSFFTTMAYRAFLRRIKSEKNFFYTKCKLFLNDISKNINENDIEELEMDPSSYNTLYENLNDFVKTFEEKELEKKEKKRKEKESLDDFIE